MRIDDLTACRHLCNLFCHYSIMNCFVRILAPCKYAVILAEDCRNCQIILCFSLKFICDQNTCILLICFFDFFLCQIPHTWNLSVNIISVRCSITWNISSCLCPAGCPCGMCMNHSANLRKPVVKNHMCRRIRRRIVSSLHFISIQIYHNHIIRSQFVIFYTAWLDHKQSALPVDPADISPGKSDKSVFWKQHIRLIHFFF